MLVWWTLLGVIVGIALGAGLYGVKPSKAAIELIGVYFSLSTSCPSLSVTLYSRVPSR